MVRKKAADIAAFFYVAIEVATFEIEATIFDGYQVNAAAHHRALAAQP